MTNVLELAKQGNGDAIAAVLNRPLKIRNVAAKAILKDNVLKIMLESLDVPNQPEMVRLVTEEITKLDLPTLQTIQLFARQTGSSTPAWKQLINLDSSSLTESVSGELNANKPAFTQPQSNTETITAVINDAIADRNLTATVELNDQTLKIVIETTQFLDGQVVADVIYKALAAMKTSTFNAAELYKQRSSKAQPFLVKKMVFEQGNSSVAPEVPLEPIQTIERPSVSTASRSKAAPKKQSERRTKKTRRMIGLVLGSIIAAFVLIRLAGRLATIFASPIGGFGVLLALFSLWRAWSVLGPLLQNFLRDD